MNWTRAADLRAQVQKLWDRGELLRHALQAHDLFPLKLKFKQPSSADLTDHFEQVREWIRHLQAQPHCRIEYRELTHRVLGKNSVPTAIWIDDLPQALAMLNKQSELELFRHLVERLSAQLPELLPWMLTHSVRALTYATQWELLLAITDWIKHHPRPNVYVRQVDLAGLHSKFIESHAGVLGEWFDLVLPHDQVKHDLPASTQFAARYGFKTKPVHIRFRLLDASVWPAMHESRADIALDTASFAALNLSPRYIFITENEVNFLAFPGVTHSMVIFGKGYGWEALGQAEWMNKCSIVYWGDIDTHGFAILDQLRQKFPNVSSLLMDKATLMSHRDCWGDDEQQTTRQLTRLTRQENDLYDELRTNAIRSHLRLEQERISIERVRQALEKLCAGRQVV